MLVSTSVNVTGKSRDIRSAQAIRVGFEAQASRLPDKHRGDDSFVHRPDQAPEESERDWDTSELSK
jgi:hypothetical protein